MPQMMHSLQWTSDMTTFLVLSCHLALLLTGIIIIRISLLVIISCDIIVNFVKKNKNIKNYYYYLIVFLQDICVEICSTRTVADISETDPVVFFLLARHVIVCKGKECNVTPQ